MIDQVKESLKQVLPKRVQDFYFNAKRNKKRDRLLKTYAGKGVACPICESEFRVFADYGNPVRKNALCPDCGGLERHRLLWKYFEKNDKALFGKKTKVLHFAPEKLFFDFFTQKDNVEYVPADLFPECYNFYIYDPKVKIQKVDITNIPFEDGYFDFILCSHVLEHIPDDRLAMSELYRVLNKKTGKAVLQVPIDYNLKTTYEDFSITDPKERVIAFGQHDHVRWYGQDYVERLASVGFKVEEDRYVETFSEQEIYKEGLPKEEIIYLCKP